MRRRSETWCRSQKLAVPFAQEICQHIQDAPKQATSPTSKFLDHCRRFNAGELSDEELTDATARLGFVNVIDAFHRLRQGEIPVRFFTDERTSSTPSIAITDITRELAAADAASTLAETEARWRLVETAWELGTSRSLIGFDTSDGTLVAVTRRRAVTSARDALNGYQKGKCFYCYRKIGITPGAADLADVDHLFPHVLQRMGLLPNLDGVWNLVLACVECNRGPTGKFDATPATTYAARLERRNEYLIASYHPLRETLMLQTGASPEARHSFLQTAVDLARTYRIETWSVPAQGDPTF